uniref:Uncharacterized protein n=1 Tax=Arundo donax TaxID=35708 RepID=A0A0A9C509_ARUDO
MSNYYNTPLT